MTSSPEGRQETAVLDAEAYRAFHEELSRHIVHGDEAYTAAISAYLSALIPASKEAEAEDLADAIVNFVTDWAAEDDEDTMRRDLERMFKRFGALSTAIPAGDGVPPGMAKSALDCVVHALMVLPVPIDGQGKRAWASLLEAQTILEALSSASTAGKG